MFRFIAHATVFLLLAVNGAQPSQREVKGRPVKSYPRKHNSLSSADKLLHPSITVKKPENAYNEDNEKEKAINPEKAVKVISKPVMPTNEDDDEDNFADVADDDDENGAEMLLQDDAKWQVILASVFVLVFWTVVIAIAYMMAATDVCWKVKVQREWQENSLEMGHIA